jgi:hypothetical protein
VVHPVQDEDVQIAEVSRDEIGDELPTPVYEQFVSASQPLDDEMNVVGPLAFPDDVAAGSDPASADHNLVEIVEIFGRQRLKALELLSEYVSVGHHATSPGTTRRNVGVRDPFRTNAENRPRFG